MTADEGNVMKKSAAVVAGLVLALGGAAAPAFADSGANGAAIGSPGVLSGNVVQIPIHIPVNVCGNTINIIALLNPSAGNVCVND
ncbi:chaplin [Streptomyces bobili]|uniref:chaplin n=1 Tax=Streptomyces bobili TaxID=67280 RepID=UPI0037A06112